MRGYLGQEGLDEAVLALHVELVREVPLLLRAVQDRAVMHVSSIMTMMGREIRQQTYPAQLKRMSTRSTCRPRWATQRHTRAPYRSSEGVDLLLLQHIEHHRAHVGHALQLLEELGVDVRGNDGGPLGGIGLDTC